MRHHTGAHDHQCFHSPHHVGSQGRHALILHELARRLRHPNGRRGTAARAGLCARVGSIYRSRPSFWLESNRYKRARPKPSTFTTIAAEPRGPRLHLDNAAALRRPVLLLRPELLHMAAQWVGPRSLSERQCVRGAVQDVEGRECALWKVMDAIGRVTPSLCVALLLPLENAQRALGVVLSTYA